ncbi:hypothetical protein RB594_006933 [Gaeumannomyces avenae]
MHAHAALAAALGLLAPTVSGQLHSLAQGAGLKYFGTAVGEGTVGRDQAYMDIVNNKAEIGQLVPENGMKWDAIQGTRGQFNYASGDISANLAAKNGQILRCHTLVWHSQLPRWVETGSWTRQSLQTVIETHINNVMGHYKGKCYAWDVVNEAVDDDGAWRTSVFYRVFGTDFLPLSFRIARAADPSAKLYYNDYNLEYNGAKTNRVVQAVQIIQEAGAPIDGVGFQGHLIVGSTPSRANLATVLRRFTSMNVEVAYTELDIRHSSLPASTSALQRQGNDYADVVGSCLDVQGCIGITVWGFTDKYSWVPGTFPGTGDALLYNSNFNRKPAWSSVSSLLAAAATGGPGPQPTTTADPGPTTAPPQPTTTPPPTGGTQNRWDQCGGQGWTGGTVCASPWTCTKVNDWYSQCT